MAIPGEVTSNRAANVASLPIGLPTNTTEHGLVLCVTCVGASSAPSINTPGGWTALAAGTSTVFETSTAVFYKVGDASVVETVTLSGTAIWVQAIAFVIDDANLSSFIDVSSKATASSGFTHPAGTTQTTTVASDLVFGVYGFAHSGALSVSPASGMNVLLTDQTGTSGEQHTLMVAYVVQAVAGATGVKNATTSASCESANLLFAVKPYLGPTRSFVVYPNGGESLVAGSSVTLSCTSSTSPTAAASTLQYEFSYSSNNGVSWTVIGLSSAGVTTKAWTVPSTPISSGYLIRVRAKDPASGLFSLLYDQSDRTFSVVAETAPPAPTGLSPNYSFPAQNKASVVTLSWVHGGGSGNPQTEFTLQWSNNGGSSWTTVGPTSTATQSTTVDFSAQTVGTTITWRVKTKGLSLESAYSANASFVVASLPTTPNITAPTAGSPPTTPNPTITHTITSGEIQVARRIRVTQGGSEVYNSGWVTTSALSVVSPFAFANGVAYVLYLAIRNQYGLDSAEDSENITPAYTGPATPTIAVTAVDSGGYVLIQITNSDTVSYNEIWRKLNVGDYIKVGASLPNDASFTDYNVRHEADAYTYTYYARAYNVSGLYTDSTETAVTLNIDSLWVHAVSRTSPNGNALQPVSLIHTASDFGYLEQGTSHAILGRSKPVGVAGQKQWQVLAVRGVLLTEQAVNDLLSLYRLNTTVCVRDVQGSIIFGVMSEPQVTAYARHYEVSFTVTESSYTEAL